MEREQLPLTVFPLLGQILSHPKPKSSFGVARHIKLAPTFKEPGADAYFTAFECVAGELYWPLDVWSLLLQCKLVEKAQDTHTSLSTEDSLNDDTVKATSLRACELVPEA